MIGKKQAMQEVAATKSTYEKKKRDLELKNLSEKSPLLIRENNSFIHLYDIKIKALEYVLNYMKKAKLKFSKEIAKEPIWLDDGLGMHDQVLCCPRCKKPIVNVWNKRDYEPNYCHYCGQHLKWEESNDKIEKGVAE